MSEYRREVARAKIQELIRRGQDPDVYGDHDVRWYMSDCENRADREQRSNLSHEELGEYYRREKIRDKEEEEKAQERKKRIKKDDKIQKTFVILSISVFILSIILCPINPAIGGCLLLFSLLPFLISILMIVTDILPGW
jgi:hypothetical protein